VTGPAGQDDGEPGRRRDKLANANAIVDELLEAAVSDLPFTSGDNVAPIRAF
jgi:dihydroxyacetone kinase-like protein